MMRYLLTLALLLVAATVDAYSALPHPLAYAASFSHISRELDLINLGNCSVANASLPLSDTKAKLPNPSINLALKYVVLGRGTQNYSCPALNASSDLKATIKPIATGAAATLFDASCLASRSGALLHQLPAMLSNVPLGSISFIAALLGQGTKSTDLIIGQHYFNAGGDPVFDLSLSGSDSWIVAKKDAAVSAPVTEPSDNQSGNVPWLKLGHKDGCNIQEVYRVVTSQGDPPSMCTGQNETFQVAYAAEYWFYG
ncbi:hypothetical protein N7508_001101 [Penicillium antarcticum]|uniref:uncharacterized protein n=1 Tax=Penicillium antarcticum TaxID=416450 RepID=UPI00239C3959|nr:uncharacterized protein N7508_001101 [Penicillium antarcticum]KAJ5316593.1 hypothetical protein N7508_001101 [Penicillium antarcticum]